MCTNDRRFDEGAGWTRLATAEDRAPGRRCRQDGFLVSSNGIAIDQRAHQRPRVEGIADTHLCVGLGQSLFKLVHPRHMDEDPPRAGAALARGADGAEHDRRNGEVQVGRLVDDHCVVTAQLQEALTQSCGDAFCDPAADGRRSGERHQPDAPVVDKALGKVRVGGDEQLEDPRKAMTLEDAVHQVLDRDGTQRCPRGRLPHAHVAANGREKGIPRPHCDRKIEGADDSDDSERMPLLVHPMLGTLGMHRAA